MRRDTGGLDWSQPLSRALGFFLRTQGNLMGAVEA